MGVFVTTVIDDRAQSLVIDDGGNMDRSGLLTVFYDMSIGNGVAVCCLYDDETPLS